ncbi:MAG: nickel-responsive transcriptional regulator NikR [Bacillota bacterium]|nr:nickel-responsive transcriptional regulator NikR [Bacillota bacterium]
MHELVRFGVSMAPELLERFDGLIRRKGYTNRSEAIRDLVRNSLVEEESQQEESEVAGTVTLIYDHHVIGLSDLLNDLQHDFYQAIVSTLHVHLDAHHCLEVLVLQGKAGEVRRIADRLISVKGVKHGKLTLTSTGKGL